MNCENLLMTLNISFSRKYDDTRKNDTKQLLFTLINLYAYPQLFDALSIVEECYIGFIIHCHTHIFCFNQTLDIFQDNNQLPLIASNYRLEISFTTRKYI